MTPKLEETVTLDFTTHSPTTGAVTDADSTPAVEVFEDANDTPIVSPTPAKRTSKTGNYRVAVACTAANGFEAGKSYNVLAAATVGGITGKAVIGRLQMRTRSVDDVLPTASYTTPPTAAAIRAEIDANSTKLDVAVSTRLASGTVTLAAAEYAAIADKLLGRSLAGGADGGRTVTDALRASRNRTAIAADTLTVYAEDDTTPAWTATITTASRDALASIDPG